ncbi:hypothetical protein DPMN_170684 [Dreissena polymorpha]|uniref:Uncharacterized protein n=1 Tax=Dreissena polymorpha TaxID=45954 RepID=A0A9D4IBR5_DREPO|nr:hypothetical protein DPMN_170684 [Dreissena polymorpha]
MLLYAYFFSLTSCWDGAVQVHLVHELLVSSRLGSKTNTEKEESGGFLRNTTNRRSNRDSAIRSLIRASSGAVQRTVMGVGENFLRNSSEDVNSDGYTPMSSPRNSAEPSPSMHRKHVSGNYGDSDLMPPPSAPSRNKVRKPVHSVSKESLVSDNRISVARQVSRSESEPNLGEVVQPSKTTFI